MLFNQKGQGKGGLIFGLLVLSAAVYLALKIVPVMIRIYSFEDRVREECKFLHGRSLEQLEADLVKDAELEKLPVSEENIEVAKLHSEDHYELRVNINYTVPIVTPFRIFNWNQSINYQAPSFE